jgi:uncharacterized membrane protein YsdA (DUF1294 family)
MLFDTLSYFSFITVLTFVTYAYDKSAARKNNWRVSERTLHILSLVGGWIGALFAQRLLRHKTVKQPFQSIVWCTVALNIALIAFIAINFVN